MNWRNKLILILILEIGGHTGFAQDSIPVALVQFNYGYQFSLFDLADRFGNHGTIQTAVIIKKKSLEFGLHLQFLFGSQVKEDVLAKFRSSTGELIGEDHQIAQVDLRQRGLMPSISLGKSIRLNTGSNLVFQIQPGWLMHWIRFQNSGNSFAPIRGEYRYGYDRFSAGFAVSEMLGYRYLSKNRLINFELGVQFTQGFTNLKRNTQLDQPGISTSGRLDGLFGLQAKWIIPVFKRKNADTIYY